MAIVFSDKNISQLSKPSLVVGSKLIYPNNQAFYGPFTNLEEAHNSIVRYFILKGRDASYIPQGLTVGIIEEEGIREYWYKKNKLSNEEYTFEDLVPKLNEEEWLIIEE